MLYLSRFVEAFISSRDSREIRRNIVLGPRPADLWNRQRSLGYSRRLRDIKRSSTGARNINESKYKHGEESQRSKLRGRRRSDGAERNQTGCLYIRAPLGMRVIDQTRHSRYSFDALLSMETPRMTRSNTRGRSVAQRNIRTVFPWKAQPVVLIRLRTGCLVHLHSPVR